MVNKIEKIVKVDEILLFYRSYGWYQVSDNVVDDCSFGIVLIMLLMWNAMEQIKRITMPIRHHCLTGIHITKCLIMSLSIDLYGFLRVPIVDVEECGM